MYINDEIKKLLSLISMTFSPEFKNTGIDILKRYTQNTDTKIFIGVTASKVFITRPLIKKTRLIKYIMSVGIKTNIPMEHDIYFSMFGQVNGTIYEPITFSISGNHNLSRAFYLNELTPLNDALIHIYLNKIIDNDL